MDQEKLNRMLYYLEYRIHTGYEAARPSRDEEKEWAEMLANVEVSRTLKFTDIEMYDLFHFIRFIKYDSTRNKCISCEFEENIANVIKRLMKPDEIEEYERYLRKIKKE